MASDLAMPSIPLETAGEQENIAASTVWTVQDNQAWIRGGPPDFARDGTRIIPKGTRVLILETQGTYARVATTGHAELGWTARSNLTTYYGRQPDLLSARLAPSQLITIDTSWPNERRELARAYNRLGGLLTLLATQARLEVPAILAVWQVESGGAPHVPGHAVIRFENHLFWRLWGHHDPERFDACFQFGGRPPMTDPSRCDAPFRCHRYRPPGTSTDPAPAWRPVHPAGGSQDDEYAALRLAQNLAGDEPALTSISLGGPQILIANHTRLGYDSAREMYDAFQASEAAQLLGFADFCEHDGAGGDTLQRLRDHDWPGFARRYNGTGQVTSYATRLERAYGQASQLFHPERTPATERVEPETDETPRQTTGQLDPETDEAPLQITSGNGEPGEALAGHGRDLPDPALTTAILAVGLDRLFSRQAPVVAGQPFDLGEGRTVEVVAAPRGYLTSPAEAGDLLVRQIYGEKPAVTVLDTNRLYDAATVASAAIPSESILPGRYATVRHNGEPRLRRLVDTEDRMPPGQALLRPARPAWEEGDAAHAGSGRSESGSGAGGGGSLPSLMRHPVIARIFEHVEGSDLVKYAWKDRGPAPIGYLKGMALTYARAYCHYQTDGLVMKMTKGVRPGANTTTDAVAKYANTFMKFGADVSVDGVHVLRGLFTILFGLGMRESGGKFCAGWDTSKTKGPHPITPTATNSEAGLFQISHDIAMDRSDFDSLVESYKRRPSGFLDVFSEGVTCHVPGRDGGDIFGAGVGKDFQQLSKDCPAFSAELAALGLRTTARHWGPINVNTVEIRQACWSLLLDVESAIDDLGGCVALD